MNQVLFSRKSDEWATPRELYEELNNEFNFTLDPAATSNNAKCEKYYTIEDDGLEQDWGGQTVFCNPPYSKIKEWVRKAYTESLKPDTTVVLLIPSRTDTSYFHDYILGRAEIRFIRGRLKFEGGKYSAPFPSMIVIYKGGNND